MTRQEFREQAQKLAPTVQSQKFYGTDRNALFGGFDISVSSGRFLSDLAKTAKYLVGSYPEINFSDTDESSCSVSRDNRISIKISSAIAKLPHDVDLVGDLIFGVFIHECGHAIYTFPEQNDRSGSEMFRSLINIVEDRRIESKLLHDFPGYGRYIKSVRSYYTMKGLESLLQYKRSANLDLLIMNVITSKFLYPDVYPIVEKSVESYKNSVTGYELTRTEEKLKTLYQIIDEPRDYRNMTFPEVQDVANRLYELFDNDASSSLQLDIQHELMNEASRAKPKKTMAKIIRSVNKVFSCSSGMSPKDLEKKIDLLEEAEEVLSSDDLPLINVVSELEFKPKVPSEKELRDAKDLAKVLSRNYQTATSTLAKTKFLYGMEEGDLDEDSLTEVRFSRDIFMDEVPGKSLDTEIIILMDASGSMTSDRISEQFVAAYGIALAFHRMKGCSVKAYAHSANIEGMRDLRICNVYEKGALAAESFRGVRAMVENADGYAIEHVATKFSKKRKTKILVTISDGSPAAVNYIREAAINHTAGVVAKLERAGIRVLSVPVGDTFKEERQKQMFKNYIPFTNGITVGEQLRDYFVNQFKSAVHSGK